MGGFEKIEIAREDLENLTTKEIMAKYGCCDSVVGHRRQELGVVPKLRKNPPRTLPADVAAKAVSLYVDEGLTLKNIYRRFPQYTQNSLKQAVKEAVGKLEHKRRNHEGWCAT